MHVCNRKYPYTCSNSECDDGGVLFRWEAEEARDPEEKLKPGDTYSDVECPHCEQLMYPITNRPMPGTSTSLARIVRAREEGATGAAGKKAWEDNPYRCTGQEMLRKAWDDGYSRPVISHERALKSGIGDAGPPSYIELSDSVPPKTV